MPEDLTKKYEAVIGLEVHAQLQTVSKLFAGDSASFGADANTHISPVTLGHPGTLPRMNKKAVDYAIRMGLVCHSTIEKNNYFARKNYFYPDLPKGYQISQHTTPICSGGFVTINTANGIRDIQLTRIHMEEDAGKSIHDQDDNLTLLDYNRAGVPLIEIVTDPVLHSAEEASAYLSQIRKLVRWIGICDGNMEEGSLRCDANISVRPRGSKVLGTRVEVKNLNSIRHLRHAIDIEIARLSLMCENEETIVQETRGYDADKGTTFSIRTKEDAEDYRYFPEPDLAPFAFTDDFINKIKASLPSMPNQRALQYVNEFGLSAYDAEQLTEEKELSDLFEDIASHTHHKKNLANFLIGPVRSHLNATGIDWQVVSISGANWNDLLNLVADGKLGFSVAAQRLLPIMLEDNAASPVSLAASMNLLQDAGNDEIASWVKQVLESMPEKVAEYRKGKKGLMGLFVGEVKKISKGKADPKSTTALLEQFLNEKQ